ncbi:MAG: hypothetical protein D3X82_13005 [Candidatus Leucobacter sulfamidivorax]|nr:hypothetical protein [Candidatus Leucobacter sulfamidivorax]
MPRARLRRRASRRSWRRRRRKPPPRRRRPRRCAPPPRSGRARTRRGAPPNPDPATPGLHPRRIGAVRVGYRAERPPLPTPISGEGAAGSSSPGWLPPTRGTPRPRGPRCTRP